MHRLWKHPTEYFTLLIPFSYGLATGLYFAVWSGMFQAGFPRELIRPDLATLFLGLAAGCAWAGINWWFTVWAGQKWLRLDPMRAMRLASFLDLPLLLLPLGLVLYPALSRFGAGLELDVLGQVYIFWKQSFLALPPAGYLFLLWAGPWLTLSLFLKVIMGVRLFSRAYQDRESGLPVKVPVLLGLGLAFYLLLSAWTIAVYPPTGDEPHYLLMTHSLQNEGDIDLGDNLQHRDFRAFYPAQDLDFHAAPTRNGQTISKHFPLLSALLLPGYILLGRMGAVIGLALAASGLAACLYVFARGWGSNKRTALLVWMLALVSVPLGVYFDLIYPELPATLVFLLGLLAWHRGGRAGMLMAAGAVALLPWFYPKFIPLAALLGCLLPFVAGVKKRELWAAGGIIAVSAALFVWFFTHFYGFGVADNPYGVFSSPFSYLGARNALGILVDRDFGVLATSPLLMLGIIGCLAARKKNPRAAGIVGLVFLVQYALYVSYDDFSGSAALFSRQMIPGVLLLFPFVFRGWESLGRRGEIWRVLGGLCLVASVFLAWICAAWPMLRYSSPKQLLWSKLGFAPSFFPSLLVDPGWPHFIWALIWVAGIGALIWVASRGER